MVDLPRLLTDPRFRRGVIARVTDEQTKVFWANEFERYASEIDPAVPFLTVNNNGFTTTGKSERPTRDVAKRAVRRRRTILEHRAADRLRDYFREERAHVVRAVAAGDASLQPAVDALAEMRLDLAETYRGGVWGDSARS